MTIDEIRAKRKDLDREIDGTNAEIARLESLVKRYEGEVADIETDLEGLQKECPHPAMTRGGDMCPDCGWEDPG